MDVADTDHLWRERVKEAASLCEKGFSEKTWRKKKEKIGNSSDDKSSRGGNEKTETGYEGKHYI